MLDIPPTLIDRHCLDLISVSKAGCGSKQAVVMLFLRVQQPLTPLRPRYTGKLPSVLICGICDVLFEVSMADLNVSASSGNPTSAPYG